MAEYANEKLGVKFTLPENPSVLVVVTYDSKMMELGREPALIRLWEAAKKVIADWECESLPDFHADLSKVEDLRAARVVEWCGGQVSSWRMELEMVPKN